ncbi:MAP kinase MpkA [Polychaeton citri CBS 116435]|uniref:Mitogen-activated protein kinase n=1 Tax=Polychaeton citri CBS 116435 TaxID=1314669 RepID=A0A9P4UME1_9PEZI|nr:MAP kinase MpkA [Polychaeton citri CBS 116435]
MADLSGRKVFRVFNQDFIVDERYTVTKELGQGAYGIVCAATNAGTGEGVAIKKVTNVFSKKILAKRALREIKLLQHFRGHRNITCLYDMDIPKPDGFNETYLYEELMECDLAAIIRSGQPLTDAHFQSFIYQILCGLKYIHSANVLHRDLKPGNLLVNADCELKICDFGLARGFSVDPEENAGYMTEYVATRWYRAPEIMLSFQSYTKAIDVWSVGCILAELLGSKPFFKGRDYVDQLNQILHFLGTPSESTLARIGSPRAQEYVRNLPYMPKIPFNQLFPRANPDALDLLDRMLAFDPSQRISVEEALEHRYLAIWHDASDEPPCPTTFDFAFETVEDVGEMRLMILDEVKRFRQSVRTPQHLQYQQQQGQQPQHVPIPNQNYGAGYENGGDPRPQEMQGHTAGDLERELQGGLDMR